jgi:hypothetical protein
MWTSLCVVDCAHSVPLFKKPSRVFTQIHGPPRSSGHDLGTLHYVPSVSSASKSPPATFSLPFLIGWLNFDVLNFRASRQIPRLPVKLSKKRVMNFQIRPLEIASVQLSAQ